MTPHFFFVRGRGHGHGHGRVFVYHCMMLLFMCCLSFSLDVSATTSSSSSSMSSEETPLLTQAEERAAYWQAHREHRRRFRLNTIQQEIFSVIPEGIYRSY
ncbi:hypothetical protein HMI55_003997 [Coelomomyces lativittatus]|nr:hypothetical protein HMI55_003997 [Coelomomyces lativittatus]